MSRLLAAAFVAGLTPVALSVVAAPAASAREFAGPVDDYATYQPQTTCRDKARKGTRRLARWIDDQFDGGAATATIRSCDSGGTSEHKDGRAIDWTMDATDDADAAEVRRFFDTVLATDADDELHALARRMGIMYLIWDDHIYRAYADPRFEAGDYKPCPRPKDCSATARHRDHVHISLSKAGAKALTTWYLPEPDPESRRTAP